MEEKRNKRKREEDNILPLLSRTDDLETTASKMVAIATAIENGENIAQRTGFQFCSPRRDAETIAMSQMKPMELEMYEMWRGYNSLSSHATATTPTKQTNPPYTPPPFDWEKNRAAIPNGAHSLKTFTQRAEAMDITWNHQGATPEHAAWLTYNLPELLPLVKAVRRVLTAEKQAKLDPLSGLTPSEYAEVRTLQKVGAISNENVRREKERINRLMRGIQEIMAILKTRADVMEARLIAKGIEIPPNSKH
ncbi:hypothetical protein ASPZODRAFT_137029 [Penicilliopsis zonata CBS 506.65]|uniref:Uncharacterized protein n=1 Tax=Penicilliopsis zonata CBS 506.65 TaxID=1073090 RepID=A0A1L9S6T2_9EURO|nr:hypothetical protein ASPZODRAFT_137029 [Penicilliopsis zonata CBS 506.65]OJJ42887.1 hypothetical protein ASPZODRAFT_137029 [Penicilliopsis zonata CBS 506.65]